MNCMDIFLSVITGGLWIPVWYFFRRSEESEKKLQDRAFKHERQMERERAQETRRLLRMKEDEERRTALLKDD